MRVCYVVIGFHPEVKKEDNIKRINVSEPGNVIVCGVAQDMPMARLIASEYEGIYGSGNVIIYNAELKAPKSTDLPHPNSKIPSWMHG